MKYCRTCEQEKDDSDFGKRKASLDGLSAKCKTCQKVYDKARSKDQYREEQRRIYAQTDGGKLKSNRAKAEWRKRNPNKAKAHAIVSRAVRGGKLVSKPCQVCGEDKRIHAHHDDYMQPLNITWMCPACHSQWHQKNGEGKNV